MKPKIVFIMVVTVKKVKKDFLFNRFLRLIKIKPATDAQLINL
jgi:hypothetical protein